MGLSLSHPTRGRGQAQPLPPSREGAVQLDFRSAAGKGSVPWGDPVWGKEAPPSRRRLPPHWPRPSHTASPGRSLLLASPVPWKERSWEGGKWPTERAGEEEGHLSAQSVPAGRGSGWDNLAFPAIPLDRQGKPAVKRDPRGGAPCRRGGVLRLCVGGSDGWRPPTRGVQRDRPA